MDYYTSVQKFSNKLLVRGVSGGHRVDVKVPFEPHLFVDSNSPTGYRNLEGGHVKKITFDSIKKMNDYKRTYGDVGNHLIYGDIQPEYQYIAENFHGDIDWNINDIVICDIDIEVDSVSGFPKPEHAKAEINAITMENFKTGEIITLGVAEAEPKNKSVKYYNCKNEDNLLKAFLKIWQAWKPDIVTGWNVAGFDIPYIYNRLRRLYSEKVANRLSVWNFVREKTVTKRFGSRTVERTEYVIYGTATLDYIDLYKKNVLEPRESYSLDYIAHIELGEKKLDYSEYESLRQLAKEDYSKFIDYNIKDVELVTALDKKKRLIELTLMRAYDCKCNYEDISGQVRSWDVLIYNYLAERNIAIPPRRFVAKDEKYEGAFVKPPQLGMHDWVVSFDLNSLYPSIIRQLNLSPETMRTFINDPGVNVESFLAEDYDTETFKRNFPNNSIAPNGQTYTKQFQGFMPAILENMAIRRTKYKKAMLEAKSKLEVEKNDAIRAQLEEIISKEDVRQKAVKVAMNSCYGASGNPGFRYYAVDNAEAITLFGQLSLKWVERDINIFLNKIFKTTDEDYVIAGDTDSIYVRLERLIKMKFDTNPDINKAADVLDKFSDQLQVIIDKSYEKLFHYTNSYENTMIMKREAIANRGVWVAKKKYILNVIDNEGVRYKTPDLKIMGMEAIRSSTPTIVREKLKEAFHIIIDSDNENLLNFIEKFREEYEQNDIADIALNSGVNNIDKYIDPVTIYGKHCPIHVRAAILHNKRIKDLGLDKKYDTIKDESKIKYIHLKLPNPIHENIIAFVGGIPPEFDLTSYVDHEEQFAKTFMKPLKSLTDIIGWNTERYATLDAFYN